MGLGRRRVTYPSHQELHVPSDIFISVFIEQAPALIHIILINSWKGLRIIEEKSKVIVHENKWKDDSRFTVTIFHG